MSANSPKSPATAAPVADGWFKDAAVVAQHPFQVESDLVRMVAERTRQLLAKLGHGKEPGK
jgi:hypothetical protein